MTRALTVPLVTVPAALPPVSTAEITRVVAVANVARAGATLFAFVFLVVMPVPERTKPSGSPDVPKPTLTAVERTTVVSEFSDAAITRDNAGICVVRLALAPPEKTLASSRYATRYTEPLPRLVSRMMRSVTPLVAGAARKPAPLQLAAPVALLPHSRTEPSLLL